jgi:hypothetical protein
MIGFLLLLHAATPVVLSVAEVEGAQSSDIALVETQLTKEIALRLDREVKRVQVPSDCRDLERCAGALAKAQGTDEVFLLRLIQGPLSLRVEALRYRTSLEPLTAVGTLRPLDRDRVGEVLGPLLESMLVFERRKVSAVAVPAPLPEVSNEGSAWPWVFAGAGLVAGGTALGLVAAAPHHFEGVPVPGALDQASFDAQRENGDALRYAATGLVIASVTLVTIAVVELLLE